MLVQDPVLKDLWHPVLRSSDLMDRPVSREVLGVRLVVYRTAEGVHALKDLCIHRGVPLSLGKVRGSELVCAYHGWSYDTVGTCTHIPSLPVGVKIPPKACTPYYPCQEAYGFIWVCVGVPQADQPSLGVHGLDATLSHVYMGPYSLAAAAPRVIENFLDVSHLMFVHEGLLGESSAAEVGDYQVHDHHGVLRTDEIAVYQPDPDGRGHSVHALYTYEVYHPLSVSFTKRTRGSEEQFTLYLAVLPENEQRSTAFMVMERNYEPETPDQVFIDFQDTLLEQDRAIVEQQKPELLPLDLQAELHLKCDRLSIAYRRMLREAGMTFGTA